MSNLTKKNYEAIAKILQPTLTYSLDDLSPIAHNLADYFQTDNKLFDRARFLQACGIENNDSKCHLCGTIEKNNYCTNKTCYEFTKHE